MIFAVERFRRFESLRMRDILETGRCSLSVPEAAASECGAFGVARGDLVDDFRADDKNVG